ncbi:phage tail protein [Maridesulfovibrio hydrothermalis]|uniref:Phage P2 GpU n=1 Tax=Maridesulfovibrio hydrothermalis AM13 = DSM 14728 TaxID=1121451 RepID=L0R6A9_9BACT|nr:phage tail protein [Maridesulfovibrio hydrothermalis]CCO22233.1 Phage P2 GpU [Maridesulfovibrio hydrothermalis AM13 = DSM 14728]
MASSRVMMKLGDYKFSMITAAYDQLVRTNAYRWTAQPRIGREPARQYIGPGDETIELSGVVFPQFLGGLDQPNRMRTEAGKGKPLMLVDGRGKVWGEYVIEQVREEQPAHFKGGAPRKQLFSLRIAKYGEDAK